MRLSTDQTTTDETRDEAHALATIAEAIDAGARWLDTARAYGANERLVAKALSLSPSPSLSPSSVPAVRIITKCGMARPDGHRWEPDGRASSILADAKKSVAELGQRIPDLLLLHVPDPNVAFETSLRALAKARDQDLARAIGLSNVTRKQLEAAAKALGNDNDGGTAIEGVEVALGAYDDAAVRGGVLAWCKERGVPLFAYSVLGGVKKSKEKLARDTVLRAVAKKHAEVGGGGVVTFAEIMIAYVLAIDPLITPVIGARTPATARASIERAAKLVLDDADFAVLDARFPGLALARSPIRAPSAETASAEVVILMGVTGSGKSRRVEEWVARGYERLNRDTLGGTLAQVARRLGELLDRPPQENEKKQKKRVVLDNTYVTRASRSEVLRVAHARNALVRCIYLETPSHEAQVNIATRMLEKHDNTLLGGADFIKAARTDANLVGPSVLFGMEKKIEPPARDEGFASIEVVPFRRVFEPQGVAAVAIPIDLVLRDVSGGGVSARDNAEKVLSQMPSELPTLLFGWKPGVLDVDAWRVQAMTVLNALMMMNAPGDEPRVPRVIEIEICPHASGPATCWCRPPLPGLWLRFARRHRIDPRLSLFMAATASHRTMAKNLGIQTIP